MGDQRRYLARKGGYTSDPAQAVRGIPLDQDALCGAPDRGEDEARRFAGLEPEAVDPAVVDELGLSRAHKERFAAEHETELRERADKARSTRLRNFQNEGRALNIDFASETRAIEAQLELMHRKIIRRRAA